MIYKTKIAGSLLFAAMLWVLPGCAPQSYAGVRVNVGDEGVHVTVRSSLPAVRFTEPPDLVVIPGTYVYMVPDNEVDVLYFQDSWWRPYEGHWYRSRDYNGQWSYADPATVPGNLRALPQDYRHYRSVGSGRIPHDDVQRNWRQWEKEKRWDNRDRGEQGERDYGR